MTATPIELTGRAGARSFANWSDEALREIIETATAELRRRADLEQRDAEQEDMSPTAVLVQ